MVASSGSQAFKTLGLKSGALKSDVATDASSRGDVVKSEGDNVIVLNRLDSESGRWVTYVLEFCDDRLFVVRKVGAFTEGGFVDALYEKVKQYGQPLLDTQDERAFADNDTRVVEFQWEAPLDSVSLIFSTPTGKGNKLVPGVAEKHRDVTVCTSQSDHAR